MDPQSSSLRVSGTDIVDGNGKQIILKGVSQDVELRIYDNSLLTHQVCHRRSLEVSPGPLNSQNR